MLEAVLNHVNARARIAVSGMISQYNQVHHLLKLNTTWPGSNSERLKTFLPPLWSLHAPICKLTYEVYLLPGLYFWLVFYYWLIILCRFGQKEKGSGIYWILWERKWELKGIWWVHIWIGLTILQRRWWPTQKKGS